MHSKLHNYCIPVPILMCLTVLLSKITTSNTLIFIRSKSNIGSTLNLKVKILMYDKTLWYAKKKLIGQNNMDKNGCFVIAKRGSGQTMHHYMYSL